MITDYQPFVDRMIHNYEGGYGWNHKDPGGPTNMGISCFALAEHRGQKMTSMAAWEAPVRELTLTEAEQIYRLKYASAIRFDDLPAGPDVCMMDYGVNSGPMRPVHVARAIVRLPGSGLMDQPLLDRINSYDRHAFVSTMCAERLSYMRSIRGGAAWGEFGHGWQLRVDDLNSYATHLAAGAVPPAAPDLSRIVTPKARHVPGTAGTATAGSTLGGAAAAHEAGAPLWAVGAIAAGIIASGVGYEIWQTRRANSLNSRVFLPAGAV